jgi:cobalamin-dependent methionine synthase I
MNQTWNAKTLREMAERAYNYRWEIGKDHFESLFTFMETLELAEANDIDISTPQKFQNLVTAIRNEYNKLESEKAADFRNTHARQSKKKGSRGGLSKKDWSKYVWIKPDKWDSEYLPVF